MHATYSFLIHVEDRQAAVEDLLDEVRGNFEGAYGDPYCDDNNWYRIESLTLQDGRRFVCDDGEELSAHERLALRKPNPKRWQDANNFALISTALDLEMFGASPIFCDHEILDRIRKMPSEQLVSEIHRDVPARISQLYAELAGKANEEDGPLDGYRRRCLVRVYEHFRRSKIAPFSIDVAPPHEHRAYDLTHWAGTEANAILQVDIHT